VCPIINTTGVTYGAGTPYSSGVHARFLVGFVWLIMVFCVMFCSSLLVLFLLAIALSVLRITASDYPFGIFKLFLSLSYIIQLQYNNKIDCIQGPSRDRVYLKHMPTYIGQISDNVNKFIFVI
jgi:hypothetical protein